MKTYKVLVIAPSWVGDMVMSQTLFKLLYEKHGDNLELHVFANSWASGIIARMKEVNHVLTNPFPHGSLALFSRIKFGIKLRREKYDQVFILPNSLKSAILPFFAGIKKRTGFVGESRFGLINDIYQLDKTKLPQMVERFCALMNNGDRPDNIPYPSLLIDNTNQIELAAKFGLDISRKIIAFCPAAEYGPAKRWLPEHFVTLFKMLFNDGHQVIILGSNKDIAIGKQIEESAPNIINLCGKTNLTDVVDLLALASDVVTNDSGLMHIACAVGSHVIALYGSSSPTFTPPLSDKSDILNIKLYCSPCYQRTCRFGHYNCLRLITPDMVYQRICAN